VDASVGRETNDVVYGVFDIVSVRYIAVAAQGAAMAAAMARRAEVSIVDLIIARKLEV
jgi:hypothetical protein